MTIHHLSLDGFIGGSIAIIGIVLALVINPLIGNKYIFTEHIHYGFWSSNGKTKIKNMITLLIFNYYLLF